eukprot:SAG31_NODE_4893_length_2881_cov_1.559310_1_plen_149_part_10
MEYYVETVEVPTNYSCPLSDGPGRPIAQVPPFYAAASAGHLKLCQYLHRCGFDTLTGPTTWTAMEGQNASRQRTLASAVGTVDFEDDASSSTSSVEPLGTSAAVSEVSDPLSLAEEQRISVGGEDLNSMLSVEDLVKKDNPDVPALDAA